jgi:hypothetical protein
MFISILFSKMLNYRSYGRLKDKNSHRLADVFTAKREIPIKVLNRIEYLWLHHHEFIVDGRALLV